MIMSSSPYKPRPQGISTEFRQLLGAWEAQSVNVCHPLRS